MVGTVLDYAPPARRQWSKGLRRALVIVLIIAVGGAIGAAVGDWVQPDLYVFDGSLSVPSPPAGRDLTAAKRAHIAAIRGGIASAAATLNGQGIRISAAEFGERVTLKDVPQTRLISIRCGSRSFDGTLAMVNGLIVPYCNRVPGVAVVSGTLRRSTAYATAGFVLGGGVTGLMIMLRRRRVVR